MVLTSGLIGLLFLCIPFLRAGIAVIIGLIVLRWSMVLGMLLFPLIETEIKTPFQPFQLIPSRRYGPCEPRQPDCTKNYDADNEYEEYLQHTETTEHDFPPVSSHHTLPLFRQYCKQEQKA